MTFPTVATTNSNSEGMVSTLTINLPSGIASGDLLLVFISILSGLSGLPNLTTPAGWTEVYNVPSATNVLRGVCYSRVADGSEGSTLSVTASSATGGGAYNSYRITGASGNVARATAVASSTTPDPPNLAPSWGAKDTMWLAVAHCLNAAADLTIPTNYSGEIETISAGAEVDTCTRNLNAASENPGTFANANNTSWVAATVAVEPASGGAFTLAAGTGAFSLGGQSAGLTATRRLTAGTATFALAGQPAGLFRGRRVAAAAGSFTLAGQVVVLLATRLEAVGAGTFVLTGQAVALERGSKLVAAPAAFLLTGRAVTVFPGRRVAADVGAFALAGQAVGLIAVQFMPVGAGIFVVTGYDTGFVKSSAQIRIITDDPPAILRTTDLSPDMAALLGLSEALVEIARTTDLSSGQSIPDTISSGGRAALRRYDQLFTTP